MNTMASTSKYAYRGTPNSYPIQTSQQINKQKLQQIESQTFSNRTMARLIATAELYALSLGYKNPQIYKKFDQFNNLTRKNKDELEGELILQIKCCKVSMDSYLKKYNRYDFPEDFDKDKTLQELYNIKKQVKKRDKKYYDAIINLINCDTNIPSFDEELDDLENEEEDNYKSPDLQLKMDIPIMKYVDGVKKSIKNKFMKNPSYKVNLELNKPFDQNEGFGDLINVQKEYDSNYKNRYGNRGQYKKREEHKYEEYY